jgi:hypothetical protein
MIRYGQSFQLMTQFTTLQVRVYFAMKILHSLSYSPMQQTARTSENILTFSEAMRIYFTILFGVALLMLAYFYLFPNMHY